MTVVEIVLIIIGVIMMIGSYFVTEKLSQTDISRISELSSEGMERILEKNMASAEQKVEILVDDVIDKSMEIVERAMNKETNLKIQAISEYSDTVIESIHKTHNEVMFLYNMLGDKHKELTEYANNLQKMKSELERMEEDIAVTISTSGQIVSNLSDKAIMETTQNDVQAETPDLQKEASAGIKAANEEAQNHNQYVLKMYSEGLSVVEIAKKLGLGLGEVKLVIDLYKEEEA